MQAARDGKRPHPPRETGRSKGLVEDRTAPVLVFDRLSTLFVDNGSS